jgi:ankyrin repeat protein
LKIFGLPRDEVKGTVADVMKPVLWLVFALSLCMEHAFAVDPTDQDRLHEAVDQRQMDVIAALLAKGVDPNKDPHDNLAALAAFRNSAPMLALLLKAGVDINRNPTGNSWSMDYAIAALDPTVLQEMLTGKPNAASDSAFDVYEGLIGTLPRKEAYADMLGKFRPVDEEALFLRKLQMLIAAKYDINGADDKTGKTALILAVEAHFSPKLIQALFSVGADPYLEDKDGKSAVDLAADSRQIPIVRLLDTRHQEDSLLKAYDVPANSPLIGTWTAGDDEGLTLAADGTGNFVDTMFVSKVTWKEADGVAHIEFHSITDPNTRLTGNAKLGADKSSLSLEIDWPRGREQDTLQRDKSK